MTNRYKYEVILLADSLAEAERKMKVIEIGVPGFIRSKTLVMDRIGPFGKTESWITLTELEEKLVQFLRREEEFSEIMTSLWEDPARINELAELLKTNKKKHHEKI